MTGDQNLQPYAQKAIDFICSAQHPRGGWRYVPGQPGDTTVTGWQVMALKSAHMAQLSFPADVIDKISLHFFVQQWPTETVEALDLDYYLSPDSLIELAEGTDLQFMSDEFGHTTETVSEK